jgi:hypothetical protein
MSPTVRNGRGERETYEVGLVGSPMGAVERRQAADHEREGFAPGRSSPGLSVAPRHSSPVAARVLATVTGPTVTARTIEEEPAMAIERPVESQSHLEQDPPFDDLAVALAALNDASLEAIEAYSDHLAAERRWEQAREALIACYRDTGLLAVQGGYPVGDAIAALDSASASVESRSFYSPTIPNGPAADGYDAASERQPDDDAPEVVTRRPEAPAAGGGPGPTLGPQQRKILDQAVRNRGDRQATAAATGLSVTAVLAALHTIGKKGALPIDLIPLLPAGFAKYTGI